ncbi:MAG: succinate dehydrogenase/fumarate reductase iron-sulfur subunit [Planctomycetes bacterium]|nr:succinate dehydrogenase/fumarate reductase iron-sulfur subunit [Planctomycetota bacterium]
MNLTLKVWRQPSKSAEGSIQTYEAKDVSPDMSFLEMIDVVNDTLMEQGQEPIAFEHDCREGICGACSMVINGVAHGPNKATTTCQLYMRHFKSGETIYIEPWRAAAFPVLKDLIVDRSAFDRIQQAGGYISINTGCAPDAHTTQVEKDAADAAMSAAECIGCGACVAACKNASAMLFVAAKVSHLGLLPHGQAERKTRVLGMVEQMDDEGFGACTNYGECEAVCPKSISTRYISRLNRDYLTASISSEI